MAYENKTGLPSVSDILRPYINSQWFTDESRLRGDYVHAYAASYLTGLFCPTAPEEYQGYCESIRKWIDDNVIEVVLVEERLIDSRLKYTGKPDAILRLKGDSGLSLPDWKTGQSQLKVWRYANAAYRRLAQVDRGINVLRGFAVRPKPDGSGILPIEDYGPTYARDFNIFMGCLNAYKALIEKQ